jgi:hypothetical protein
MEKGLWVAMVVVGAILIYYGYSESQSFGSKLGEAFSGSPSDRTMIFYLCGAAATCFGGYQLFRGLK